MQQTQTEEEPVGRVLWGRAVRWVPGNEDPWDWVKEGAGDSGEEDGVENGEEEGEGWWTDRIRLSGVDAPWVGEEEEEDVWDEEMAARAEEEMRHASAARSCVSADSALATSTRDTAA